MPEVYCFSCKNQTNLWAGFGAKTWAVSDCSAAQMETRKTKSLNFPINGLGLLYCSAGEFFTMPFKIRTEVEWRMEAMIWPEPWAMPFGIEPLGSPKFRLGTKDIKKLLDCMQNRNSITDVFYIGGACNFTPSHVPEDDWQIILEELAQF